MAKIAIVMLLLGVAACDEGDDCTYHGGCYTSGTDEATCWWTVGDGPELAPSVEGKTCVPTVCDTMEHPMCSGVPQVEFCRFACH